MLFYSCDKITPPYVEGGNGGGTNDSVNYVKKVLVEDFTAHLCNNCPRAHKTLEELKELYGDKIVAIGIHVGDLAAPLTQNYFGEDFRTTVGNDLDNYFSASNAGLPVGMVNRKKVNDNFLQSYSEWGSSINEILQEPQWLNIVTSTSFDTTSRKLNVTATVYVINTFQADSGLKLCFYLTEDSLIGWQKDADNESGEDVSNYVHRHVLRAALNGTWGETISLNTNIVGYSTSINVNNFEVSTDYNENHCYIVTFVYNVSTLEILQADETPILH